MITSNIDVPDGLVNGAIGILRLVEFRHQTQGPSTSEAAAVAGSQRPNSNVADNISTAGNAGANQAQAHSVATCSSDGLVPNSNSSHQENINIIILFVA